MIKMNLDELKQLNLTARRVNEEFDSVALDLERTISDSTDNISSESLRKILLDLSGNFWNYSVSIRKSLNVVNHFLEYQVKNYVEINADVKQEIDSLVSDIDGMIAGTFSDEMRNPYQGIVGDYNGPYYTDSDF